MNTIPIHPLPLAEKIERANAKLRQLEREVEEIGMPAAYELKRRVDALRIEEKALNRNFEEFRRSACPDESRSRRLASLLHHIEREESAVAHEADFLHQAAPSSMTLAMQAGAHMVDLYRRGLKHVIGDHHLLGESVFVNHTHESLAARYGISDNRDEAPVRHVPDL